MFGITNFRWGTDDRTELVRDARRERNAAQDELAEYSDHHYETHPRSHYDTPEYFRLNAKAWDAQQELRRVRGW